MPSSIPDEHAVFTEPIAAACEILEQVCFSEAASIAVVGDGKLGLLIAQVFALQGLSVNLFGRNAGKLEIVKPLGIKTHLVARENPALPEAEYRFVVDATGSALGFASAMRMIQPRGTLVMKSTVSEPLVFDTAPLIVNEITLVGSRCGLFEPALRLLKAGQLILEPMIDRKAQLSEAADAFRRAQEPGVLKLLLKP